MKFCYIDESGMGSEPVLVVAGVIVDSFRMRITKEEFSNILDALSKICKRRITEFHTREFYNGNGPWRSLDGPARVQIIDFLLDWLYKRKHGLTFTAIEKSKFEKRLKGGCEKCKGMESAWRAGAIHLILSIQKCHQTISKNKGHTVIVFDRERREEIPLTELVKTPPAWTCDYYGKKDRQEDLDQIVDVPYFADSKHALLLQMADLVAYLLRKKVEITSGVKSAYVDEDKRIDNWVKTISKMLIPQTHRWPTSKSSECAKFYKEIAPESLLEI